MDEIISGKRGPFDQLRVHKSTDTSQLPWFGEVNEAGDAGGEEGSKGFAAGAEGMRAAEDMGIGGVGKNR